MSLQLPQNVFLDLDGTLLDSMPGIAFSVDRAIAAAGLPQRTQDLRPLIGPPIRQILMQVTGVSDATHLDELEQLFRHTYDMEGWLKTPCFPDAKSILKRMHQSGRRLFVISNKPRHISVQILDREGVLPYFAEVVTRDSKQPPYANKAQMIEFLFSSQQILPYDAVMVGDTMEDARAAAETGAAFIFLEHGYGVLSDDFPALFRFHGFADFGPYLP